MSPDEAPRNTTSTRPANTDGATTGSDRRMRHPRRAASKTSSNNAARGVMPLAAAEYRRSPQFLTATLFR